MSSDAADRQDPDPGSTGWGNPAGHDRTNRNLDGDCISVQVTTRSPEVLDAARRHFAAHPGDRLEDWAARTLELGARATALAGVSVGSELLGRRLDECAARIAA